MTKHNFYKLGSLALMLITASCNSSIISSSDSNFTSETSTTSTSVSSTETTSSTPVWDGNHVTYNAVDIQSFGSGTPAGVANYQSADDTVVIWNIDASLDNYGGIQTPRLALDFSKAVIFEMDVISSYSQYIVKLAVEGESEYYYVLSDEGDPGLVSINVVDAMLSDKYEQRNTQPDPGYQSGWKYDGQVKNCAFHILAKGPDGERQTAELVLNHISIYNDQPAVTDISIVSDQIIAGEIAKLKGSEPLSLSATISPSEITDKSILWSSSNSSIAPITADGVVSFNAVGKAEIIAKSRIDQSKQTSIEVNVLSGYENVTALKDELDDITYGGSSIDVQRFSDLFNTTWGSNIDKNLTMTSSIALDSHHDEDGNLVIENYFDSSISAQVTEAETNNLGDNAKVAVSIDGIASGTLYRLIDGSLHETMLDGPTLISYAVKSGSIWERIATYREMAIVVSSSGDVYRYDLTVLATNLFSDDEPSSFMNPSLWTIPDRTKQAEDPVVHALSPASLSIDGSNLVMKQDKYPEAKYCFGGIVSSMYDVSDMENLEILLDVTGLNRMNDYVKTMWEIKILYYQNEGNTVVSSNPLKVASGNTTGLKVIPLNPSYDYFRLYLVVNGSDIGAQFADAEMRLASMKIYALEELA